MYIFLLQSLIFIFLTFSLSLFIFKLFSYYSSSWKLYLSNCWNFWISEMLSDRRRICRIQWAINVVPRVRETAAKFEGRTRPKDNGTSETAAHSILLRKETLTINAYVLYHDMVIKLLLTIYQNSILFIDNIHTQISIGLFYSMLTKYYSNIIYIKEYNICTW